MQQRLSPHGRGPLLESRTRRVSGEFEQLRRHCGITTVSKPAADVRSCQDLKQAVGYHWVDGLYGNYDTDEEYGENNAIDDMDENDRGRLGLSAGDDAKCISEYAV